MEVPKSAWEGPIRLEAQPDEYAALYCQAADLLADATAKMPFADIKVRVPFDKSAVDFISGVPTHSTVVRIALGVEPDELRLRHQVITEGHSDRHVKIHECVLLPDAAEESVAMQTYSLGLGKPQALPVATKSELPTLAWSVEQWSRGLETITGAKTERRSHWNGLLRRLHFDE